MLLRFDSPAPLF